MGQALDRSKSAVLDRIVTKLPTESAQLARILYEGLGLADLASAPEEVLAEGARSLWDFIAEKPKERAKLRLSMPDWAKGGAVAEIVNDDMPFLLDSTVALFNRHGLTVELLAHPIFLVTRDARGAISAIGQGVRESVMSIHLSGCTDAALLAEIERDLGKILDDVRIVVGDWRAMLHRLSLATAELDDPVLAASSIAPVEIAETKAFLRWLAEDRFTLLGYREYLYEETRDGPVMRVQEEASLGLARDSSLAFLHGHRNLSALPPDIRAFLEAPHLLFIAKANQLSPVHRPVHMDIVGVKKLDASGKVVAERRFIGLFTSSAYSELPKEIPLLRQKIASVIERGGFDPASHDRKALAQILDTYPRDELFTIPTDELFDIALGVLQLQDRRRIALFVRRDPFERFVSCLVYVPRDRYDADLRDRFHALLEKAFSGAISASYIHLTEAPLARLHLIVKTNPGAVPAVDLGELENQLVKAGRLWSDDLAHALKRLPKGGLLAYRYGQAFDAGYRAHHDPEQAVCDLLRIESLSESEPVCRLDPVESGDGVYFRLYRRGHPAPLSDVLPILENHGLRVLTENPYQVYPKDLGPVWQHDFECRSFDGQALDVESLRERFEAGFLAGWRGEAEEDGFNRLILNAGLTWREAALLRAYAKYLRQIGFTYSQPYIEETLARHCALTALLVALFHARLSLDPSDDEQALEARIREALEEIAVADEDRILRRFLDLILATVRTNYYQRGPDGQAKPYLSIKFDSAKIEGLPKPRPYVEIWVCSPEVEAVHLRGGKVARGGIRWSDRREDFRTEILGLIKAQMVKNAMIVPSGSKGGFVVKRPPPPEAGRAASMDKVIVCYRTMMQGLLDLTDNRKAGVLTPPLDVRRRDGDDPYLVVAADKGTAAFSDIANGIAQEYGFWLDDAFASGGSAGYDHKALGITAAGAWVAVERHLRQGGIDLHGCGLDMVGVGDMSGDVFGNGLLHSNRLRLIAAFDHRHIFIDPNPDPQRSFAERRRLFDKPGSSWAEYDASILSAGGAILARNAKNVSLSQQAITALGIERPVQTPAELMQAILKAPVDLLWFGGIGTYIKAGSESHTQIGDRANDALRVDGREVRAKVIGEGANLGVTQRGRIEYAAQGGRINTDAIDNSAGVDMSDHEVNIKILTADLIARQALAPEERDGLLASMAKEVSQLVLRDNDRQTFSLSLVERDGPIAAQAALRSIPRFARTAGLDRTLEALPSDADLAARIAAAQGLLRPEIAVLLAFAKIELYNALLASSLPDDPALEADLIDYFPTELRTAYARDILQHGLRREIVATQIANAIVDRGGIDFAAGLEEETGASNAKIAAAFCAARDLFQMPVLWHALDGVSGLEQTYRQIDLARASAQALRRAVVWLLSVSSHDAESVGALSDPWRAGVAELLAPGLTKEAAKDPEIGLSRLENCVQKLEILPLAAQASVSVAKAAELWAKLGDALQLDRLLAHSASFIPGDSVGRQALAGILTDFARHRRKIAMEVIAAGSFQNWQEARSAGLTYWSKVVDPLLNAPIDLSGLAIVEHSLRRHLVE